MPGTNGVGPTQIAAMDVHCTTPPARIPARHVSAGCRASIHWWPTLRERVFFNSTRRQTRRDAATVDGFNISLLHVFRAESDAPEYNNREDRTTTSRALERSGCFCAENIRLTLLRSHRNFQEDEPINVVRDTSRAISGRDIRPPSQTRW